MIARFLALLAVLAVLTTPVAAAPSSRSERVRNEAESLFHRAIARLQRRDFDSRRMAVADLERCTLLVPDDPEYQLALARLYVQCGYLKSATRRFEIVTALQPDDPEARFGLGQVWRRDWLKYLEPRSLERAIEHFSWAARLEPAHTDAWLLLSSLLVERGDVPGARAAAEHALRAEPGRPEALLAVGATRWRLGDLGGADSAYRAAMPRLRRSVRERFDDIAPLASERDTMLLNALSAAKRAEFLRAFWVSQDPDLASAVNEAQLEYWARVTQAYFLFYDPRHREWDQRGEVYVRYGPPGKADYNPVGSLLYVRVGRAMFPANVLVWSYPDLGMNVAMQDRTLSEYYQLPIQMASDPDPRPDPDSLAARGLVATQDGRGVFAPLPPGSRPLPVRGEIATFGTDTGARLFAGVETPGEPADTLWAEWVVLDSARHEVTRGGRSLSASACEPTARRVADFAATLAPGEYLVGLTVTGTGARRGSLRRAVRVTPPPAALTLSDVVVTCGTPGPGARMRLEPNPAARVVPGAPLLAYFEVAGLEPDTTGTSRLAFEYTVRSARRDSRVWLQRAFAPRAATPPITASREDEQVGSRRRQYVSVPVQDLPPGRYALEIRVQDLVSRQDVRGRTEFERVPIAPAP
jgi:GWxTD domain-containing protein